MSARASASASPSAAAATTGAIIMIGTRRRMARRVAALALLALLSGCVVYAPGYAPYGSPHYHYWR
jgi:hypothetical protein